MGWKSRDCGGARQLLKALTQRRQGAKFPRRPHLEGVGLKRSAQAWAALVCGPVGPGRGRGEYIARACAGKSDLAELLLPQQRNANAKAARGAKPVPHAGTAEFWPSHFLHRVHFAVLCGLASLREGLSCSILRQARPARRRGRVAGRSSSPAPCRAGL